MTKQRRFSGEGALTSLNEGSQLANNQHPADALGDTLRRINTLLSAVAAMFEPGSESFAVNNGFVMHSMIATQGLVETAQSALVQLHASCDLTLLAAGAPNATANAEAPASAESQATGGDPIPFTPLSSFSSRFVDQAKSTVANQEFVEAPVEQQFAPPQEERQQLMQEGFAQSYLELLRKLTAAEIFAAEQQALSPPGTQHQLLPLLRSLREDFQKIHSAA